MQNYVPARTEEVFEYLKQCAAQARTVTIATLGIKLGWLHEARQNLSITSGTNAWNGAFLPSPHWSSEKRTGCLVQD